MFCLMYFAQRGLLFADNLEGLVQLSIHECMRYISSLERSTSLLP